MEPKNFPGTGDLDAIAHRSASTAVNHLLIGMALGDVPNDMELWVQEFLKEMLQNHPQKSELISRSMYFANLMLAGRNRRPHGYENES